MTGEEPKRLHVHREVRGRAVGPVPRRLRERNGVVRGVDLDQGELRRVEAQAALGVADAFWVELLRRDERLVAPRRGTDQDLHRLPLALSTTALSCSVQRREIRRANVATAGTGLARPAPGSSDFTTCELAPPAGRFHAMRQQRFPVKVVTSIAMRECS